MTSEETERKPRPLGGRVLAISLFLFLGTMALYQPVQHYDFLNYDDPDYVTDNAHVLGGITLQNIKWAFTTNHASNWHPITWLSHMLDVELWGKRASGHHLANVILHAANALLLFLLLFEMTGALSRSAFVAAVFATHPLHVESVAWISERKDVLSTLFWILAIWMYVRYARTSRRGNFAGSLAFFACALMSKAMVVTLPFLLLLLDYWPLRRADLTKAASRQWLRLTLEKVPFFALAAIGGAVTIWAQHNVAIRSLVQVPLRLRLKNIPISYLNYLTETIWPVNLAAFYPFPTDIALWLSAVSAFLIIGLTIVAFISAKSRPYLAVGWLWFLVTLIPVIGLVQVGDQAMADRYMYTPLIGLLVAATWGTAAALDNFRQKRIVLPAIALIVLGGCVGATAKQLPNWRDNFALYQRALRPAHNKVGHPFFFDGLADALLRAGRFSEADQVAAQALQQFPPNAKRLDLAGKIKFQLGHTAEAEDLWLRSLQLDSTEYDAHNNLGIYYSGLKRWSDARHHFEQLVALRPGDVIALGNLAQLCFLTGDYPAAKRYCQLGLRAAPNDPVLLALMKNLERREWNEP